jgi:predicted dehydrogenase
MAVAWAGPDRPPVFDDPRDLLARGSPDAVAIFTPHRFHYRQAMDALQAGCHVFVEKPLSTVPQEAHDIVQLARARGRIVAVGHQYRLVPALIEARSRLASGVIGEVGLVTATLALPWLETHSGPQDSWRLDPKVSGGGILADAGDHLLDALLWTTGQSAVEVAAFQERRDLGLDVITAAAVRLSKGSMATLAISGVSAGPIFELVYLGENGRLRVTDRVLRQADGDGAERDVPVSAGPGPSIDANFVAAVRGQAEPCCPAEAAIDAVRLLEALGRSAASGQMIRLM